MSSSSIQLKEIVPSYDNNYDNSYDNGYNNDYDNDCDNDCDNNYNNNTISTDSKQNNGSDVILNCSHKEFSCGCGGSTTTLWHHLESAYRAQYVKTEKYCKKIKKMQDECGTVENMFRKNPKDLSSIKLASVDNMRLWDMFAVWIVNHQCPLAIIEDPKLIKIIEYLNPTV
ncbi:5630_t:CDS:2, partial [Racocetra persica]